MKKAALLIFISALAACSTPGTVNPADALGRACPVVQGTILTLGVTEGITDKTRDKLKEIAPVVAAACAAPPETADIGVDLLVATAIPLMMQAINDADIKDDKKQAALIALVAVQVMLAGAH